MIQEKIILNLTITLSILFIVYNIPFILLVLAVTAVVGLLASVLLFIKDIYKAIFKRTNNE